MASVPFSMPRLDFRDHPKWSALAAYFMAGWLTSYPVETELLRQRCSNNLDACFQAPGWMMRTLEVILWPLGVAILMPWTFSLSVAAVAALVIYSMTDATRQARIAARAQAQWRKAKQAEIASMAAARDALAARVEWAEMRAAETEDERDAALAHARMVKQPMGADSQHVEDEDGPNAGL